jgi:hypothetical protein
MTNNNTKISLDDGIVIEYLVITPTMAKSILEKNVNRSLRPGRVKEYSDAMKAGQWQFNGDTIRLDRNDVLRDGQHRLEACIVANRSFPAVLITGLPPQTQSTMDTGSRRSIADTLKLAGEDHAVLLASVLNLVNFWETSGIMARQSFGALTANNAVDMVRRHEDIRYIVKKVAADKLHVIPSPSSFATAAYIIFESVKGDEAKRKRFDDFINGVMNGFGISGAFDPRAQLRNRFARIQQGTPGRDNEIAASVAWLTIRAWDSWVKDEEVTKLQIGGAIDFSFNKPEHWRTIPNDKIRFSRASNELRAKFGLPVEGIKKPITARSKAKAAA